ncbi:MAG: UMP kinase [Candidatus Latescibacteria bacterium]|jgi:uridylate kinase|nr:UMP kinase [Candidatus Latescibacterota bacterium]
MPVYKRILLKLSGEALSGEHGSVFDSDAITSLCNQIRTVHDLGVETAVVVGGGNIFRGLKASHDGMNRVTADSMGMLATMINGLALQEGLERTGIESRILSSRAVEELTEPFNQRYAIQYLEQGNIVIFVGGTGNPFFSTDSAASLRAAQIRADVVLKGTKVDGVYDSDPVTNHSAKKFDTITFNEVLNRDLLVMDATAIAMCRENNIPIVVFNLIKEGTLIRAINGEPVGTVVKENVNG